MFGLFPPERSASLTTQWVPYTASTEPFSCWAWEVIGSHAGPRRLLESRGRWRLCFPALPCRPPAHLRPPLSPAPSRAAGTTPPRRPWGLLSGLLALSPSPLLAHCDAGGERALSKPLIGRYLSPSFPSSAYLPFAFTLKRRHRGCLCPWEAVCGWCRSSAHSFSSPPRSPKPGPFGDLTLQPLPSPEQVELDGRERRWGWRGD